MGKDGGVAIFIVGLILFLIGLTFLWAVLAANLLIIAAGQYIIIAIILMGVGAFLMKKGHDSYNSEKRMRRKIEEEERLRAEYRQKYGSSGNDSINKGGQERKDGEGAV